MRNPRTRLSALLALPLVFASFPIASPAGSLAATPLPFLWGAATSSYQVEGGIDCSDPTKPCNDYDFFNRDPTIHAGVASNTGLAGPAVDTQPAGIADNVWDPATYERDFDYARMLGLNSFRFSLEWGRIEPTAPSMNSDGSLTHNWDEAAIQHYVEMVSAMRARGLVPVVTLNHFTLPIWVLTPPNDYLIHPVGQSAYLCPVVIIRCPTPFEPGYASSLQGWNNPATIDRFVDFVSKVVPYFRGKVDHWLTVNEPAGSQVGVGYVAGIWPPGFVSDGPRAQVALHNLIVAHVRAYDAISDCTNNPACDNTDADGDGLAKLVGFAHAMGPTVPAQPGFLGNAGLNAIAADNFDYFMSAYFLNAVVKGEEDTNYLTSPGSDQGINVTVHEDWKNHLDFLGINYYRRFHVYHDDKLSVFRTGFLGGNQHNNLYGEPEPHELLNDLGWAMYPQGLYEMIMRAKNTWNVPVMITENGTPDRTDRTRASHIVAHLRQIARAITDGASVIGYMHWSLIDNWELQENYSPQSQFGLFHIDRSKPDPANPDLHRQMTEGALAYQQFIAESRATSSTGAPTAVAADNARDKFGELSADGTQTVPPTTTHGRLWAGTTSDGPITLYLGYVTASQRTTGLLYRHNTREWREVELLVNTQGPFLREKWFDDATESPKTQDIAVGYSSGLFTFAGSGNTAARISGTGLWQWQSGQSPWGGDHFYVSKFEDEYAGKYMTFSEPGPKDVPTPVCGAGGCVPQVAASNWRPVAVSRTGTTMLLNATGGGNENLFQVSMTLTDPSGGASIGTTTAANSGVFTTSKAFNVADAHFHLTGYVAPGGDNTWIGERDGASDSKFQFLETRAIFQEFSTPPPVIGGSIDQYEKENDPHSVMPLRGFNSQNGIRWEAGGRFYSIVNAPLGCLSVVCSGTWTDIAGRVANRLSERFRPVVAEFANRTIEGNTTGGANLTLSLPAFDLDGLPLTYKWTGDVSSTAANPNVFLSLGSHNVCVEVDNGVSVTRRCATLLVADTVPPTITIGAPQAVAYEHSATLTLAYSVTDISSGVKTVTALLDGSSTLAGHGLANGQVIDLLTELPLGSHEFRIDAEDNAGNRASKAVTFTIIVTPSSISTDVTKFRASGKIKNDGLANSLLSKLAAAAAARAAGNCATAAAQYQAFIAAVTAQSGKGIDPKAAEVLIADAQYLIDHCP